MNTDRHVKHACRALGAAIVLAGTVEAAGTPQTLPPTSSAPLAIAPDAGAQSRRTTPAATQRRYPPGEAGVRRAAAQGSDALRRYIWRTRMIYNYYYRDFAKRQ